MARCYPTIVDPEITQHFENIERAMARMAAAEARTEERLAILKESMHGLAATMKVFASAQARTEDSFERLIEVVARGFTQATERHGEIIERLDRLIDKATNRGP